MAITASDLEMRLSGGAANTSPAASLGSAMSTAGGGVVVDNVVNNLFDNVTGDESAAGDIEYRAVYLKNAHGSLTWYAVFAWISSLSASADTEIDLALASEAVNVAIAQTLPNENTAPSGVSFTRPTSKAAGLSIGDVPAGQFKGLWIRRTIIAGAAPVNDTATIKAEGDTGP